MEYIKVVYQKIDGYHWAYITNIHSDKPVKEVGLLCIHFANNTLDTDEHRISSDLERIFIEAMYALMEEL